MLPVSCLRVEEELPAGLKESLKGKGLRLGRGPRLDRLQKGEDQGPDPAQESLPVARQVIGPPHRLASLPGRHIVRIAETFPFVEEAGIGSADDLRKVVLDILHRLCPGRVGDRLDKDLVDLGKMPQEDPFGALQFVAIHILPEVKVILIEFAGYALRLHILLLDPGMRFPVFIEGPVKELAHRFRMLHVHQAFHPFLVGNAFRLHLTDHDLLQLVNLPVEDDVGILDNGLAEARHLEAVFGILPVELVKRVDKVQ